ncbi:MAG: hypothetical protein EON85_09475 [Brevundimonas sp.]|nr:MAG: hypothetical protein EON85_09475 [Brevundimonas sp.]
MIRSLRAGVTGIILALTPAVALAHDSFLAPTGPLSAGRPIHLALGSGAFPNIETPTRPDRIARVNARAADTRLTLAAATAPGLTFEWPDTVPQHQNGVVVAVDMLPRQIEVGPDEIDHYMDEIGAPADVAAAARAAVARDGVMRRRRARWRDARDLHQTPETDGLHRGL